MSIPPNYNIAVNSDNNIVITHPASDNATFKYLRHNLKSNEIIGVFEVIKGGENYISKKQKQWLVKNYSGISDVLNKFSDKNDIRISKSVSSLVN